MTGHPISRTLEFHDSTLAAIQVEAGDVVLELSPGYVHRWEERDGRRIGTGWETPVRIRIVGVSTAFGAPQLPADIADGDLVVGDGVHVNRRPPPISSGRRHRPEVGARRRHVAEYCRRRRDRGGHWAWGFPRGPARRCRRHPAIADHVPAMRGGSRGADADRRLRGLLRVHCLQDATAPEARRLLRVLLVRHGTLSARTSLRHMSSSWAPSEPMRSVTRSVRSSSWRPCRARP